MDEHVVITVPDHFIGRSSIFCTRYRSVGGSHLLRLRRSPMDDTGLCSAETLWGIAKTGQKETTCHLYNDVPACRGRNREWRHFSELHVSNTVQYSKRMMEAECIQELHRSQQENEEMTKNLTLLQMSLWRSKNKSKSKNRFRCCLRSGTRISKATAVLAMVRVRCALSDALATDVDTSLGTMQFQFL